MIRCPRFAVAYLSIVFSFVFGGSELSAQLAIPSSWPAETENRLKDIYDRGEFRAPKIQVDWFPDSNGYTLQERDPSSDKTVGVRYDVRTGQRLESKQGDDQQTGRRTLRSPDGKHVLEFRDRELFVRNIET
ncbi:MAG: S9 family peptidase, partial [bacterium]